MDFSKKFLNKTSSTVTIFIILGILFFVNIISLRHFGRLDLTEKKTYSISDGTKIILGKLDDKVTIKAYFSEKLPPNLINLPQFTRDLLDEYKAYGNGSFSFRFINPDDNPDLKNEAISLGIPEARLNVIENDKRSVQNVLFGIAIFYRDKKETIPIVNLNTLEYDLTSAIRKVTAKEEKIIGYLSGHEEHIFEKKTFGDEEHDYSLISEGLSQNYQIKEISVKDGKPIEGVYTLIIAGPKKPLSDRELYEIEQFMIRGGRVIFLEDAVSISSGLSGQQNDSNLKKIYTKYGASIINEILLDRSHADASFQQGNIRYMIPYPFWVMVIKDFMNQNHPTAANLDSLVFPWINPLQIDKKDGVTSDVLFSSTPYSWTNGTSLNLDPSQNFQAEPDKIKSHPLGAFITAKFKSSFDKAPSIDSAPSQSDEQNKSPLTTVKPSDATTNHIPEAQDKGSFILIPDSDFISDMFISQFPQNGTFFLNAVDFLTIDPLLIEIRSKAPGDKPLEEITEGKKLWLKVFGIGGMPFVLSLIGLIRMLSRKRKKGIVVVY